MRSKRLLKPPTPWKRRHTSYRPELTLRATVLMLTLLAKAARWKLTNMAESNITICYNCRRAVYCFHFDIDFLYNAYARVTGRVASCERRGSTPAAECAHCAAHSDMTENRCKATTTNLSGSGPLNDHGCIVKAPLGRKSNNALTCNLLLIR